MKRIVTPENITELRPNEVFVFGSNLAGRHGKGAARQAIAWGAVMGIGEGLRGRTYALPTKDRNLKTLPLDSVQRSIWRMLAVAAERPDRVFRVTKIGCGLAGYSVEEIAELFYSPPWRITDNVSLPQEFWDVISTKK